MEMPGHSRFLPPIEQNHGSDDDSDACSSCSEFSSPSNSLHSFNSVSVVAIAGSPPPTHVALDVGRRRVFEIASEAYMDDAAYRLADLIEGSSQESAAILHAIQLLWDSGIKNVEYARSIALITEELYMQLVAYDKAVGDVFKTEMGLLAVDILLETWQASKVPQLDVHDAGNSASDAKDTDLLRMSTFVGDLYAIGFITAEALMECLSTVVQKCTEADHLVYLFAILSRANSYMGSRLPHNFYAIFSSQVREKCKTVLGVRFKSAEESFVLTRIVNELMNDSLDIRNLHSRRCAIPYTHVVNRRYHPVRMLVDESDHLGQMYDLLHSATAPVSSNTSKSPTKSPSSLSNTIAILEHDIEQMLLSDSESSANSSEDLKWDYLEKRKDENSSVCMSVLDIDFEDATPTFVKEGLHLSLNAAVPISLTSPLPVRD